jgi:hypothetical protein
LFSELGFVQKDENLWFKYFENNVHKNPHFVLTTTINPKSYTFIIKNLFEDKTITTNSVDEILQFVKLGNREHKLKKLLD